MFPYGPDRPAAAAKCSCDRPVTPYVCCQLRTPEALAGFRDATMHRARVPKTTMNKNRKAKTWDDDIRPPNKVGGIRCQLSSTADRTFQKLVKLELRLGARSSNQRHPRAALEGTEIVGHLMVL